MIWFSCFSLKADINQGISQRTKGSVLLLISVLTYQKAERLVGLELYVGRGIWMAGNLIWAMYFSLYAQIKYEMVETKSASWVPTTFLSNAHAFPPKLFLLTGMSVCLLFSVRRSMLPFYFFLDLEQSVVLLKSSCAFPISINGMSSHFEERKSVRTLKIYKSCSF